MSFPVDQLRPSGGEIYAVLFENPLTDLPLGVYWSFRIDFAPLRHQSEEFCCNLMADWARIPIRDWRELAPHRIQGGPEAVEASFYTDEHDLALATQLAITARDGARFRVDWVSVIDYPGRGPGDADPRLPVHAACWVPFSGVIISDDLVQADDWQEQARSLLSRFLDLRAFGGLVRATNEFGVEHLRLLPE